MTHELSYFGLGEKITVWFVSRYTSKEWKRRCIGECRVLWPLFFHSARIEVSIKFSNRMLFEAATTTIMPSLLLNGTFQANFTYRLDKQPFFRAQQKWNRTMCSESQSFFIETFDHTQKFVFHRIRCKWVQGIWDIHNPWSVFRSRFVYSFEFTIMFVWSKRASRIHRFWSKP